MIAVDGRLGDDSERLIRGPTHSVVQQKVGERKKWEKGHGVIYKRLSRSAWTHQGKLIRQKIKYLWSKGGGDCKHKGRGGGKTSNFGAGLQNSVKVGRGQTLTNGVDYGASKKSNTPRLRGLKL